MDPVKNPFVPGAGTLPPKLAGRDEILERARILLARTKNGIVGKSFILTGLRGVGKTVLLVEIESLAKKEGFFVIRLEAREEKSITTELAKEIRRILLNMSTLSSVGVKLKKGLSVFLAFIKAFKISVGDMAIEVSPELGTADSGDIEDDMPHLLTAVAEAAQEHNTGIALIIDEIHELTSKELNGIIVAMQRIQQKQLPFVLIGAGLPTILAKAGKAKTYSERLFDYPQIGALSEDDTGRALSDPVEKEGMTFEDTALKSIYEHTLGYPYFIQTWGHQTWDCAEASPFTANVVEKASEKSLTELDQSFFRVRFDRLTPKEKEFMHAMAKLKGDQRKVRDVSALLGTTVTNVSKLRDTLIKKGMIYSPSHGEISFTVPLFDEFMLRTMRD